jgi:hypothetical protein
MLKSKIYFNHIPKTAGTTFFDILKKQYRKDELYSIDIKDYKKSFEDFQKMNEEQKVKIKCVSGHLSVFLQPKDETETISFLRNPIDRTLSSFYYIKRAHWNKDYEGVKNLTSIGEFVKYRTAQNLDNQQTRYMAQDFDYLINDTYPNSPVDEAMYERALANLKRYKYTFITEKFDEALICLYENLKWRKIPFYKIHNKTENRKQTDSLMLEELDTVKSFCYYDLKLYDEAKMKHQSLLKNTKGKKWKLRLIKWLNKLFA